MNCPWPPQHQYAQAQQTRHMHTCVGVVILVIESNEIKRGAGHGSPIPFWMSGELVA